MSRGEGVAISLFFGAGGLDLGVEQAGYTVAAAVEPDRDATTVQAQVGNAVHPLHAQRVVEQVASAVR